MADHSNMEGPNFNNKLKRDELNYNATELGEVKTMPISDSAMTSSSRATIQPDGNLSCNNVGCKSSFNRLATNDSPWNLTKTVFLITGIVSLILWIIIYSLVSHYQVI